MEDLLGLSFPLGLENELYIDCCVRLDSMASYFLFSEGVVCGGCRFFGGGFFVGVVVNVFFPLAFYVVS